MFPSAASAIPPEPSIHTIVHKYLLKDEKGSVNVDGIRRLKEILEQRMHRRERNQIHQRRFRLKHRQPSRQENEAIQVSHVQIRDQNLYQRLTQLEQTQDLQVLNDSDIPALHKLIQQHQRRLDGCRIHQRDFRQRRRMQQDIAALKAKITDLQTYRSGLQENIVFLRHQAVQKQLEIVDHFTAIFKYGTTPQVFNQQLAFLRSIVTPTFRMAHKSKPMNLEFFLRQSLSITTLFPKLRAEILKISVPFVSENMVRREGISYMPITRQSIQALYPHVYGNEHLTQQVIGQILAPVRNLVFYFNRDCKLEVLETEINLAAAWANVIKPIEEARIEEIVPQSDKPERSDKLLIVGDEAMDPAKFLSDKSPEEPTDKPANSSSHSLSYILQSE